MSRLATIAKCRAAQYGMGSKWGYARRSAIVNSVVWLVGAVVIVLFVLGFFGLR